MTAPANLSEWTDRLMQRDNIFPFQVDFIKDQILLINLSSSDRNAASFLDHRIVTQTTPGSWLPWPAVEAEVPVDAGSGSTHFIFHVGHCGSTLISRLLAHAGMLQAVREPLILRSIAQELAESPLGGSFLTQDALICRLRILTALWGRGAVSTLIKATSICTGLMPYHLAELAGARSIFIFNRLETHLTTMLAGNNHQIDLKNFARMRVQRLRHMTSLDVRLDQLGGGELIAMSWLCEVLSAYQARQMHQSQVCLLDFDRFLASSQEKLLDLHAFLGSPIEAVAAEQALQSSIMTTYSKAPEYKYSPQMRAELLAESSTRNQKAIREGINWIDQQAGQSQVVSEALKLFR